MDPINHNHLYYSNGFELYESANAGESWKHLSERSSESCPSGFIDILFDPSNGTLYTAVYENTILFDRSPNSANTSMSATKIGECDAGVYRSKDGGKNWDLLLQSPYFNKLFMNPDHGEKIYAWTHTDRVLYGSSDSGETWEEYCEDCQPLGVDESGEIIIESNEKLLRSKNGTSQWETFMQLHQTSYGAEFIVFNPHEQDSWYFGSSYLRITHDGGKTTSEINSGLGAAAFNIYIDKKDDAVMYAQIPGFEHTYRSLDGGSSMDYFEICPEGHFGDSGFFLNNEDTGGITAHYTEGSGLRVSKFGVDWEDTYTLSLPDGDISRGYVFTSHPAKPDLLFFVYEGDNFQIFLSTDKGNTWQESINNNKVSPSVFHFSEINSYRIFIVTDDSVSFSQDGGKSWKDCTWPGNPGTHLWLSPSSTNAATHPDNEDWLMVASQGNGVYILENDCLTVKYCKQGLKSLFVNSVVVDQNNPEKIYAGTDGGAFISLNGGEEWREINDGLLGANLVFSLAVDSQSNVFASTPYGIFKLEDK